MDIQYRCLPPLCRRVDSHLSSYTLTENYMLYCWERENKRKSEVEEGEPWLRNWLIYP